MTIFLELLFPKLLASKLKCSKLQSYSDIYWHIKVVPAKPSLLKDKSITAVYVDATVVPEKDETNLGTQYVNVVEDNDFIWFEEMEAKVKG